jgi:hypothetical protein
MIAVAWAALSLALFASSIPEAFSATFYVDNSCANNGNGTVASCASSPNGVGAWNNLTTASTCPGMSPGDHLQFRNRGGTHPFVSSGQYALFQNGSGTGCSGASGNPMIFENYPGEDAVFDGSVDIHKSTWTAQGGGVYLCSSGTCGTSDKHPFMLWYVTGAGGTEQEIYMDSGLSRACDSTLPAGRMRYTSGNQVCVHLPDGTSPAAATSLKMPLVHLAFQFWYSPGPSHILLRKNPSGGSFTVRRFVAWGIATLSSNQDIAVDGLDVGYMMDRCLDFETTGANVNGRNISIKNSHIHHCGQEGLHSGSETDNNYVVDNNEWDHIQSPPWFPTCSGNCLPGMTDGGCAIRVFVNGTYAHIGGNDFHDIGGSRVNNHTTSIVNIEGGAVGLVMENNYFHDSSPKLGTSTAGVAGILISAGPPSNCTNCTFRNNRFYKVDQGIAWEGNGDSSTVNIYNNTFVNVYEFAIGQSYGTIPGTIVTTNNIFANTSTPPVSAFISTGGQSGFTSFTYNAFFCNGCSGSPTLAKTKTSYAASAIANLGTGNVSGDPNIDMTGSPPTLNILGASGIAYQQGTVLTPTFPDYLGNARPQSGKWDIGAFALESTGVTLAPPTNLRVQ